jgi:uncharacterized cupin superfamily protein
MPQHILNIADLELRSSSHGEKYASSVGTIGAKIGAKKLGYNLTVLPPGKRAYPAHNHRVNEEMFFVLEGEGEVRIGNERFPIKKGDAICCPPGGPELAHQIVNTSKAELRYLAVSTKMTPELVDYPDSKKFGVLADLGPGPEGKPNMFRYVGRAELGLDYYEGE